MIQSLIVFYSLFLGVDPVAMVSICYQESRLKNVTNHHDNGSPSYGPCQIKAAAAKEVGISKVKVKTLEGSIEASVKYFKVKMQECKSLKSSIGAYNSGRCVKYPDKNEYVKQVMIYYKKFKDKDLTEDKL